MSDDAHGLQVGSQFGQYRLKRLIGRGGMGVVYEAEDTAQDRVVALKLLLESLSSNTDFRKRLQREARIAGRLQEPHVVPIHHCGEIDGQWYVDMRLIDGTDLHSLLSRYGPLSPERAVGIVAQVAAALDAAHAAGVIHRDVKPENILITGDDFAYLVDFGLANAADDLRLTQLGTAVGTWAYMAPERFGDEDVTYRADIYALACVLYEALTGSRPYTAGTVSAMVNSHLSRPIPRPSRERAGIPAAFDDVIARGMAKDPADRYATAGDLALAAERALSTSDRGGGVPLAGQAPTMRAGGAGQPPSKPSGAPGGGPGATSPYPGSGAQQPPVAPTVAAPGYLNPAGGGATPPPANPPATAGPGASWPQQPQGQSWPQQPPGQSWPQPPAGQSWPSQPPTQSGPQQFGAPPAAPLGGPPGGPPPAPGVGQQPWSPGPPARKRNRWILIGVIGAAAVVVVAVVAVIGIWLGTASDNHPTPTSTAASKTTTATTTTSTSRAAAQGQLLSMLPQGYAGDTCKPTDPDPGALATVGCDQNTEQGGPDAGVYSLYPDANSLQTGFTDMTHKKNQQLVNCPGATGSAPSKYHKKATPNIDAGLVACGHYPDFYAVTWTVNDNLVLGAVSGNNLKTLYDWWGSYG